MSHGQACEINRVSGLTANASAGSTPPNKNDLYMWYVFILNRVRERLSNYIVWTRFTNDSWPNTACTASPEQRHAVGNRMTHPVLTMLLLSTEICELDYSVRLFHRLLNWLVRPLARTGLSRAWYCNRSPDPGSSKLCEANYASAAHCLNSE